MTNVGVLCNLDMDGDPMQHLSPSVINRACLIDRLLAPQDIRLFLYCPKDVAEAGEVSVGLPVLESLRDLGLDRWPVVLLVLVPGGQLGAEPIEGLSAQLGAGRVVGRRLVLASAGAR